MKREVRAVGLGMPWESEYGYAQGVCVGNSAWLAGQLGHDEEGNLLEGMDAQMMQTYRNARKVLADLGFSLDDVVEEIIYVLDTKSGFVARKKAGREFYANPMLVASTLVGVTGLALPEQLVEIRYVAKRHR